MKLRIISRSGEPFLDRQEAGRLLAAELSGLKGERPVVLGIPRGGIVVADEIARGLNGELDIVLAHKLRTPGHPELAMGSVTEDGRVFLNEMVTSELGDASGYIEQEKAAQLAEIRRRTALFRRVRPKVALKDRIAIITDDGIATGATMQAAIWAARLEHPRRLIVALPVGPEETLTHLARDVDEMLCLRAPPFFSAVGQFYEDFQPVEDEDVLSILSKKGER
jgi:putative phosphoribosyl transferase